MKFELVSIYVFLNLFANLMLKLALVFQRLESHEWNLSYLSLEIAPEAPANTETKDFIDDFIDIQFSVP